MTARELLAAATGVIETRGWCRGQRRRQGGNIPLARGAAVLRRGRSMQAFSGRRPSSQPPASRAANSSPTRPQFVHET